MRVHATIPKSMDDIVANLVFPSHCLKLINQVLAPRMNFNHALLKITLRDLVPALTPVARPNSEPFPLPAQLLETTVVLVNHLPLAYPVLLVRRRVYHTVFRYPVSAPDLDPATNLI